MAREPITVEDGRGAAMAMRTSHIGWVAIAALSLTAAFGCTTHETEAPPVSGPSGLGLSLQLSANPDVLTMDGGSQSTIGILALNASGQPAANMGMRVETRVGGALVDIGRLSSKSVTTGGDGRASVVYTAPSSAPEGNSDSGNVVTIAVTPASTDYANAIERVVNIRLVPRGTILAPSGVPLATFTFSPAAPTEGQSVTFDASGSRDCPADTKDDADCTKRGTTAGLTYKWTFGDGTTGVGAQASHAFKSLGSFAVTLQVSNERGNSSSTTKMVEVGVSPDPALVDFVFSPTSPEVLQSVFFDASMSKPAPGRTIVGYDWTFGDGGFGTGVTTTHRFGTKGSYTVVLTVTDDLGKYKSATKTVTLGDDQLPLPKITASPANPAVGQSVTFDGRLSTPPPGRSLVGWEWQFGDGGTGNGERVTHSYTASGDFVVVLTVTDSSGAKASTSQKVSVGTTTSDGHVTVGEFRHQDANGVRLDRRRRDFDASTRCRRLA